MGDSRRTSDKVGLYSTGGPPPRTNRQPRFSGPQRMGDQLRPSTSFGEPKATVTLQAHTSNWNQILNKERSFFTEPYERCVLVQQNLPGYARVSGDNLRSYFESLGYCGGRVVSMRRMNDGVLVEFEDHETAQSVWVNEHTIGSLPLKVHQKIIPSIHDNCFVVEGNFDSVDELKAWLECAFSGDDFAVECHSENVIYLVKFSIPVDYQELVNFAKKMPLDKIKPKFCELTHSDCIIVKGLPADFTNDNIIQLTFMSKNRSGGGPVTMVKRKPGDTSAFVYFSNWQDAANVVEKSRLIQIGGTEVEVCLWYNHVASVTSKKKPARGPQKSQPKAKDRTRSPLHSFELVLDCDPDIVEYVKSSSGHIEKLNSELEPLALIDFPDPKKATKVRFKPNFKKLNPGLNQVTFEEDCSAALKSFLAIFATQTETLNSKNLGQLRASHIWSEPAGLLQVEVDENVEALQVFVRWNSISAAVSTTKVQVAGLVHEVPEVINWLKKKCNASKERISFTPEEFQILIDFKMIDDLIKNFRPNDVHIKYDESSSSLALEGSSIHVKQLKKEVKAALQNLDSSPLSELKREQVDFLRDVLAQPTTTNVKIRDTIQQHFKNNNINAFLRVQPTFALVFYRNVDLHKASQYLDDYISRKEIEVRRDFNQITQSQDWKRLEQDIDEQQTGRVRFLKDKRNSKLILVGVKSSVRTAYQRIIEHIEDNVVETRTMKLDGVFASFLQAFPDQIQANVYLASIEWEVNLGKKCEISLKGKNLDVAKAEAWLDDQKGSIQRRSMQINKPGMSHYFLSAKGTEFLQTAQTICKCIILVDSRNSRSSSSSSSPLRKGKILICGKLPGKEVTIYVTQNDITELSCEAIVNTSNEELELRNAGVSGAIFVKGGASIQQAMNAAKKRLGGKLTVGLAETTDAGNLPCNKIVHVVGPEWTSTPLAKASSQLTTCVFSCFTECERYNIKSVAIPAISCGVFGGKPAVCVDLILTSIRKYLKFQDSTVKEVFLIENSNREVLDAFVSGVKQLTGAVPNAPVRASSPSKPAFKQSASPQRSTAAYATASQAPNISLLQGDIANVKADVIVTSCTPKTFHSCSGSATTKALLAAAGPGLRMECQQNTNVALQVGNVMQTSGHNLNCSEVFYILLSEYDGSNDDDVRTAIQTCLLMAEGKGYSRIAFPAVGTGGMNYPPGMLAMWLFNEINAFEGINLRNVDLVLHPSDRNTISAFEQVFGGTSSEQVVQNSAVANNAKIRLSMLDRYANLALAPSSAQPYQSVSTGGVTFQVNSGNILQTTCEALVCPTSSQYNLSSGQLSKMLLKAMGMGTALQIKNPKYHSSYCRVIEAGNSLRSKFVIFVISSSDANQLTKIISSVLSFADTTLKVKSVALPAISTGKVGLSSNVVAQSMATAFQTFQATTPQFLKHIEVVIYENVNLLAFQSAISNLSQSCVTTAQNFNQYNPPQPIPRSRGLAEFFGQFRQEKVSPSKSISSDSQQLDRPRQGARYETELSLIPTQRPNSSSSNVTIDLCSTESKNIDQAQKRIEKEVEEKSLTKTIENDVIGKLSNDEESEIMELEEKHNISIWVQTNNQTELVLCGLKDDVYKAQVHVAEILHDYKAALTCAEYVMWQYHNHFTSNTVDFSLRESSKIESSFKENENGSVKIYLTMIDGEKRKYLVDFNSMTALTSGMQVEVKRQLKTATAASGDDLPSQWADMGDSQFCLVPLSSGSAEYRDVINKFGVFGSGGVVSLERIQNPTLYKQFAAQKRKVETRMQQRGIGNPVTRELFHGTSGDVCARIYKDGFDRSHCGKHGTSYGRGVYFATSAHYSQGYVKADAQNRRRMFLAEVITGEYCVGSSSMNVLPELPGTDTQYDSAVNNVQSPSMYVVFKDASVYPSYIVTF